MRAQNLRLRLTFACLTSIVAMLALSGSAEARAKKPTLMNSCSCACRQDSATWVFIANKDFFAAASCGSFSGTQCNVTVTTSEGTRTVSGTWGDCVDHGKVWVLLRQSAAQGVVARRAWLH